jgi:hypothetical protein
VGTAHLQNILAQSETVTPQAFVSKWRAAEIGERQAAQSHFIDLCRVLGQPSPTDADPKGEWCKATA